MELLTSSSSSDEDESISQFDTKFSPLSVTGRFLVDFVMLNMNPVQIDLSRQGFEKIEVQYAKKGDFGHIYYVIMLK